MTENTRIEWATHTFNPWRGCSKVADGCANCYAEREAKRFPKNRGIWGLDGSRVLASEEMWEQPVKWNKAAQPWPLHVELCRVAGITDAIAEWRWRDSGRPPDPGLMQRPRVFCASLADVFEKYDGDFPDNPPGVHGGVRCLVDASGARLCTRVGIEVARQWPNEPGWRPYTMHDARDRLLRLIDDTLYLDWLLLTKRPENIREMWLKPAFINRGFDDWQRYNVWLGTSIATQADADQNIPELLECRDLAAKSFLSIEPLIEEVDLSDWLADPMLADSPDQRIGFRGPEIDWVIVGGESGPGARPCVVDWIRTAVRQCRDAGVPCFVKQLGANVLTDTSVEDDGWPQGTVAEPLASGMGRVELKHRKGGDPEEWPEDLRVRQFPAAEVHS